MECVELTGSDTGLDCGPFVFDWINALPVRCSTCGFPDLDAVPQPYRILRSRAMTPHESVPAAYGNLLVRDRVRRVLDLAAPGACTFHPTVFNKGTGVSPWSLAVPTHQAATGVVDPAIPRCPTCGEPRSSHPGTQWVGWLLGPVSFDGPHDVFKATTWASGDASWKQWLDRAVFMSARLFGLLERLGVKGLDEATCSPAGRAQGRQRAHRAWIDEQLAKVTAAGVPTDPPGKVSAEVIRQFKQVVAAASRAGTFDRKAAEKRLGFKLPPSVADYYAATGRRVFQDVDDEPGFTVRLLPVEQWDVTTYRRGAEGGEVDGVMFAATDDGDCFCLDLAAGGKEYPVRHYRHEQSEFEPYAASFAACVVRFAAAG